MGIAAYLLRSARVDAGVSQRRLAALAETTQPRVAEVERSVVDPQVSTLDRLLRAAGSQLTTLPTRAPTAASTAAAITETLASLGPGRGLDHAFRTLLSFSDGLASSAPDVRVALCAAPPEPTGDARFDAALAAVVDHHLSRGRLPVPGWTSDPSRVLGKPWTVDPYAGDEIVSQTPRAFRRRGVLLAERELASA